MKKTYKIPENTKYVTVEATTDGITTIFESNDTGAFISDITGELEYIPNKDDLSIFWGDINPRAAIIAKIKDIQFDEEGSRFEAKNGLWYTHAIRFRNEEQYEKILQSHAR